MPKKTMNIRIDSKLKKNAENIISELGISMSSAITLYLKAIVREKGIPFLVTLEGKKQRLQTRNNEASAEENYEEDNASLIDSASIKNGIDKL